MVLVNQYTPVVTGRSAGPGGPGQGVLPGLKAGRISSGR